MMYKTLPRKLSSNSSSSCPDLRANGLTFQPIFVTGCIPKSSSVVDLKKVKVKQSPILNASFREQDFFEELKPCTSRFWNNTEPALRIFSGDVEGDYAVILHLLSSAGIIPSGSLITPFFYSGELIINPCPETPSRKENISNIYLPEFKLSAETMTLKENQPIHLYSSGDLIDRGPHGLECLLTIAYICNLANTNPDWEKITFTTTMGNHDICYFLTPKFIDHVEYVIPTAYGYSEDSDGYNLVKMAYQMLFQNTEKGPSKPVFCKVNIDNMSVVSHAPITEGEDGFLPLLSDSWSSNPLFFKEQIKTHFRLNLAEVENRYTCIASNLKKESTSFSEYELEDKKQWLQDLEFAINSHLYLPTFYDNPTINVPLSFTKTIKDNQGEDFNLQNFSDVFSYLYYFYNKRKNITYSSIDTYYKKFLNLYKKCICVHEENKKNSSNTDIYSEIIQNFNNTRDDIVRILELCKSFKLQDKIDWNPESELEPPVISSSKLLDRLKNQSFDDLFDNPKQGNISNFAQIKNLLHLLKPSLITIKKYFSEISQVNKSILEELHYSNNLQFTKVNYEVVNKAIHLCHELDYPEKAVLSWGHLFHDIKSPCWQRFTSNDFNETCRPIAINGIYGHDTGGSHEPAEYHVNGTITLKVDTAQSFGSRSGGNSFFDPKRNMTIYNTIPTTLLYNWDEKPIINSLCHPLRFLSGVRHPKRGVSMKNVKKHFDVAVSAEKKIKIKYPKGTYCDRYFPDPTKRISRYIPMFERLVSSERGYLSQLKRFIADSRK